MSTATKSKARPAKSANGGQAAVENKKQVAVTAPQSAAAPSPFTPIADYAFRPTATRGLWLRRTAPSIGRASRALTRPACLVRCWTGAR